MTAKKPTLTDDELKQLLQDNPQWRLAEGKLVREWSFKDFAEAMVFVNRVAGLAETSNHHPDIDIRYNRVTLALVSHDAGGISLRDAALARDLNAVS
jgi:4a-hydroxytetrahydrobiopterin dehydratase